MDLDVFGACQTRRMYESKPPQREPQRVAGRPPPFVWACFRTFGVFDKLRRLQDPSKCIKIRANPSIQYYFVVTVAPGDLFGVSWGNYFFNRYPWVIVLTVFPINLPTKLEYMRIVKALPSQASRDPISMES